MPAKSGAIQQQLDDLDGLLKRLLDLPLGSDSSQATATERRTRPELFLDEELEDFPLVDVNPYQAPPHYNFPKQVTITEDESDTDLPVLRFPPPSRNLEQRTDLDTDPDTSLVIPIHKTTDEVADFIANQPSEVFPRENQTDALAATMGPVIELHDRTKPSCDPKQCLPLLLWPFWLVDKTFDLTLGWLLPFLRNPFIKAGLAFLGVGLAAVGLRIWLIKLGFLVSS